MKITVIGPVYPYRGGIAHYTTLLAQNLSAAGHQVQVISFRRQYPAWLYPGETDKDTSQNSIQVPAQYLLDPLYPWTWLQTAQEIAKNRPDLVILQYWTTFWALPFSILSFLLKRRGIRLVTLIHNVMPHEPKPWDCALSWLALSPADQYITQTEKEANRLGKLLPKARVTIAPHPVYTQFAGQTLTREQAREELDLPQNAAVLLFFGIVRPYKGLRYLIQAVSLLERGHPDIHLLVAGEFWEAVEPYRAIIDQLEIGDRVHLYNYYIPNEEVPQFFSAADIFVAPYIEGTQSGAAKMALGFGQPIVLTEHLMDETLAGQPNVFLAKPRDPESLAEAVERALGCANTTTPAPAQDDWHRLVQQIEAIERGSR